jgi:hypothetical protein
MFSFGAVGKSPYADFLIAGVDSTGGHIFRVFYAGVGGGDWLEWCDRLGYRAIGGGWSHATVSLALEKQHRGLSVAETAFNAYCAKRNAEIAPGVGRQTDLSIIENGKLAKLGDEQLEGLEALRASMRARPSRDALEEALRPPPTAT